jgi:hypothetical protein
MITSTNFHSAKVFSLFLTSVIVISFLTGVISSAFNMSLSAYFDIIIVLLWGAIKINNGKIYDKFQLFLDLSILSMIAFSLVNYFFAYLSLSIINQLSIMSFSSIVYGMLVKSKGFLALKKEALSPVKMLLYISVSLWILEVSSYFFGITNVIEFINSDSYRYDLSSILFNGVSINSIFFGPQTSATIMGLFSFYLYYIVKNKPLSLLIFIFSILVSSSLTIFLSFFLTILAIYFFKKKNILKVAFFFLLIFLLIFYSRDFLFWKLSTGIKFDQYYYAFIGVILENEVHFFGQDGALYYADNGIYTALINYGVGLFLSFYSLIVYILYKYFLSNMKWPRNDTIVFFIAIFCFLILSSLHYSVFYKYGIKYLLSISIAFLMFYIKLDKSRSTKYFYHCD